MDRHDDAELDRNEIDSTVDDRETHATMGGAAAAGAVTGGVIGLTGGPIGAAIGAVGGAIVGAAAERMMHGDHESERARPGFEDDSDRNPSIEDRSSRTSTPTSTDSTTIPTGRVVESTPIQRQPSDQPGSATGESKSAAALPEEQGASMERRPG